jgi:hypothetical protein
MQRFKISIFTYAVRKETDGNAALFDECTANMDTNE